MREHPLSVQRPGDGAKRSTGRARLAAEMPAPFCRHHPATELFRLPDRFAGSGA